MPLTARNHQPDLILIAQRCYLTCPGRPPARAAAARGLTIWRDDPFTGPAERLLEIGIAGIVVDGQVHLTQQN